jgi:iron complex outermembrane recepter protein
VFGENHMLVTTIAKPCALSMAIAMALLVLPMQCPAQNNETHSDTNGPTQRNKAELEEATTLGTIEVRAQEVERREQRLHRVQHQGSSVTIGREHLEQSNVIGTEDLLRHAPNITIRSRYIGDRNALIGGRSNSTIQGSRSLVYIDGLLISDLLGASFNPPRWGMVSPAEIQSMYVLYGPFSAELPGNSMGTTVQITTRYPRDLTTTADLQLFSQNFSDDYGYKESFNGNRLNVTMGKSYERWRWFGAVSRLDTTSHPMQYATANFITANNQPVVDGAIVDIDPNNLARVILGPTGIEDTQQINAKLKTGFDISDDATLEFVLGYWQNVYDRRAISFLTDNNGAPVYNGDRRLPDGRAISVSSSAFSPQAGNEEHWQSALSLTWKLNEHWALQAIASDYRVAVNELRSASTPPLDANNGGAGNISFGDGTGWNTFDLKLDGHFESHRFRYGVHADRYVLETHVFNTANWLSGIPTTRISVFGGKAKTIAAYVQEDWKFAPGWELGAGLRYEQWTAFDGIRGVNANPVLLYAERKIDGLSPNLSLSKELGDSWKARASVGKAVRFPTVSELFQGSVSGQVIINSDPSLEPEESFSKEFALEGYLWDGDVRASLFEDDIRNSLFSQTNLSVTPTITNIQNIGRMRNRGIEFVGEWKDVGVDGLSLIGSLAFNRSRILDNNNFPASEGKRAPRIPATRASAVLSYKVNEDWRFSFSGRYSGRQWNTLNNIDTNPDVFGGTSSFTVFDAKVTRRLLDGLSLGMGIDNLSDKNYFVFHPYPRRTFFLELRYGENTP